MARTNVNDPKLTNLYTVSINLSSKVGTEVSSREKSTCRIEQRIDMVAALVVSLIKIATPRPIVMRSMMKERSVKEGQWMGIGAPYTVCSVQFQ